MPATRTISWKNITESTYNKLPETIEKINCVVIGDAWVGGRTLMNQFAHEKFKPQGSTPSEFRLLGLISDTKEPIGLRLIRPSYHSNDLDLRFANIGLFVFDVNNAKSFENLNEKFEEFQLHNWNNEKSIKILIGNKTDVENQRIVSQMRAKKFAESKGMVYVELSAKESPAEVKKVINDAVESYLKTNPELYQTETIQPPNRKEAYEAQYKQQLEERSRRTLYVVLAAIFLTPLSLLVTIPLWFRAKRNELVQKVDISQEEYDEIKRHRESYFIDYRGSYTEIQLETLKGAKKPNKIDLSTNIEHRELLMDRGQYKRFELFKENSRLGDKKAEIDDSYEESKEVDQEIISNHSMKP